jgi:hypothetical protein
MPYMISWSLRAARIGVGLGYLASSLGVFLELDCFYTACYAHYRFIILNHI